MIELEKEFVSGSGGFSTEPLTYKQIKRNGIFAIYERSRDGRVKDFEVIVIKTDPKGMIQKFPQGITKTLEDDIERYPSTGQWGRMAWSFCNLGGAQGRFDALVAQGIVDDAEEETPSVKNLIVIPEGEWTVGNLAEKNGVEYVTAHVFVKKSLIDGSVNYLGEKRLHTRGKASKIFTKA